MTNLCASIGENTLDKLLASIRHAYDQGVDICELRFDALGNPGRDEIEPAIASVHDHGLEVIATVRAPFEGGLFAGAEVDRLKLLPACADAGADYVDVELQTLRITGGLADSIARRGAKLIVSTHDFERTRDDIDDIFDIMLDSAADVVKLATTANSIADSIRMLLATERASRRKDAIGVCMGEAGLITRLLAPRFGAFLTFASVTPDNATAPGQISVADLRTHFQWDAINTSGS